MLQLVVIVARQNRQADWEIRGTMQLDRLLSDVTQSPAGTSRRQRQMKLTELLQERHGADAITYKGVAKWFERNSVPSTWLLRIAQLPKKPINLAQYA